MFSGAQLEELLKRIVEASDPVKVILFGSSAAGCADKYSDIDVAVIAESALPFVKRLGQSADLLPESYGVDLLIYTPSEFQEMLEKGNTFANAINAGRVLYEKPG